jgi:hypothetical protein
LALDLSLDKEARLDSFKLGVPKEVASNQVASKKVASNQVASKR